MNFSPKPVPVGTEGSFLISFCGLAKTDGAAVMGVVGAALTMGGSEVTGFLEKN